jgi:SAM-dependent methyltransferase
MIKSAIKRMAGMLKILPNIVYYDVPRRATNENLLIIQGWVASCFRVSEIWLENDSSVKLDLVERPDVHKVYKYYPYITGFKGEIAKNRIKNQDLRINYKTKKEILSYAGSVFRLSAHDPIAYGRHTIVSQYLKGDGLEIGALHLPLGLPAGANVRYLDYLSVAQQRIRYPELKDYSLAPIHIIDDGEELNSIKDESFDFVVASHIIEHTQNPILSLKNWLRVVKSGGILYLGVPDKRLTFDEKRTPTSIEHLLSDYQNGPEKSKNGHYKEWAIYVDNVSPDKVDGVAATLAETNYSIHFHVWEPKGFLSFLSYCQNELTFPFELELFQRNESEFICILKKNSGG